MKKAKIIITVCVILVIIIGSILLVLNLNRKNSKDTSSNDTTSMKGQKIVECVLTKEPVERPFNQSERVDKLKNMQNFYCMYVPHSDDAVETDNTLYYPVSDYQHVIIGQCITLTDYFEYVAQVEGLDSNDFEIIDTVDGYYSLEPVTYYLIKAPYGTKDMYIFLYCIYTYDDDGNEITSEYVATLTADPKYYQDSYDLLNEMFDTRVCLDGDHLAANADKPSITSDYTQDFPGRYITVYANGRINTNYKLDVDLKEDFPYTSMGDDWDYLAIRVYGEHDLRISEIILSDGNQTITEFRNVYDPTTITVGYGILLIDISNLDLSENSKFELTLYTEQELNIISLGRIPSSVSKQISINGVQAYEPGLDTVSANVIDETNPNKSDNSNSYTIDEYQIEDEEFEGMPGTYQDEEEPEPHH